MTTPPRALVAATQRPEQNAGLDGLRGVYATLSAPIDRWSHSLGVVTTLAGTALTSASGYLGGHITMARKVDSRNAAFGLDAVVPTAAPGVGTEPGSAPSDQVLTGRTRTGGVA